MMLPADARPSAPHRTMPTTPRPDPTAPRYQREAAWAMRAIEAGALDPRCSMLRDPQQRAATAAMIALDRANDAGGLALIVSGDGPFIGAAERLLHKRDPRALRAWLDPPGIYPRTWLAGSLTIGEGFDLAICDAPPGFGDASAWRVLRSALRMPPVVWLGEGATR